MHEHPPRLANAFFTSGFTYDDIGAVAERAEIPRDALVRLLLGQPAPRSIVEKIITIINEQGQKCRPRRTWLLEDLDIKML